MERKIGEIFEFGGEWYQCVVAIDGCRECSFRAQDYCTRHSECFSDVRSDGISVIFKKLEKVGEPITVNGKNVQLLKTTIANCDNCAFYKDVNCDFTCYPRKCHGGEEGTYVEIKTKENMEEYRMHDAKEDIPEFDKVVDECLFGEDKLNLKPFDLEAAKAGKPVCTRDGRKARIICFDRRGDKFPIVALLDGCNEEHSEVAETFTNEGLYEIGEKSSNDLMMLPEKKEGWVNVYKDLVYDTKEEALAGRSGSRGYIDTINISWEE